MSAYRFTNLFLMVAALFVSAAAAYFFFGRTELDAARMQAAAYQQKIMRQLSKAEQGDINAQYRLAKLYLGGDENTRDLTKALKWLRSSAAEGQPDAQYELGRMYTAGEGVGQSYYRAAEWLRLAARVGGNPQAQFALGELYFYGRGVTLDYVEALKWFRLAAEHGHPVAQDYLGGLYERGWGTPRDLIEAYKWYDLAGRHVDQIRKYNPRLDPAAALANLASRMNQSQIETARQATRDWLAGMRVTSPGANDEY